MATKFLATIGDPSTIITPIDASVRFPEILDVCNMKYALDIANFKSLIATSASSADLLKEIRSNRFSSDQRMSLLKMFRRAVSPVLDTEMAKKIRSVSTDTLIATLGHTFKPIEVLNSQFAALTTDQEAALAALIGEYDTRGQLGYMLTAEFFNWFEGKYKGIYTLQGPRGAGPDVELSSIFPAFSGSYPCDFVIRSAKDDKVLSVGFARYDSTRGGAQSDDRTGGNSDKVAKAKEFFNLTGVKFRILFLSDGPGLAHRDTWTEACNLDGIWDGNVRVSTLKTADQRITPDWLEG
jgi:hypothetical protein